MAITAMMDLKSMKLVRLSGGEVRMQGSWCWPYLSDSSRRECGRLAGTEAEGIAVVH